MGYWLLIFSLILAIVLWAALKRVLTKRIIFKSKYILGDHLWGVISESSLSTCAHCGKNLWGWFSLRGLQCQICQISSHKFCIRKQGPCKRLSSEEMTHQFVSVFLPPTAKCERCKMLCGSIYADDALQCLWCQMISHRACKNFLTTQCNMHKLLVPPTSVHSSYRHIGDIPPNVQPVVVVINPKSGGQSGLMALRAFYSLLNPIQVINLVEEGLERIKLFRDLPNVRILCAGGDGTVSAVLNWLYDDSGFHEVPPVGIFPLGTGNDLSIILKWGKGLSSREGKNFGSMKSLAYDTLRSIYKSHMTFLDRWEVSIVSQRSSKKTILCNYLGIGLDAKIAYEFHSLRESKPYLFISRGGNRFIYSQLGGIEFFSSSCRNFSNRVSIRCDSKRVKFPYIEGFIVLNIGSYAGGVDLWGEDDMSESSASECSPRHRTFARPSKQDGKIELLGFSSVLHLGECQIGLSQALKLAQGNEVEIEIRGREKIPLQIDGEPQIVKGPAIVTIKRHDQVTMLAKTVEKYQVVAKHVMDVLDWASLNQVINSEQKKILTKEFARRANV